MQSYLLITYYSTEAARIVSTTRTLAACDADCAGVARFRSASSTPYPKGWIVREWKLSDPSWLMVLQSALGLLSPPRGIESSQRERVETQRKGRTYRKGQQA